MPQHKDPTTGTITHSFDPVVPESKTAETNNKAPETAPGSAPAVPPETPQTGQVPPPSTELPTLEEVLGDAPAKILRAAGIETIEAAKAATREQLDSITGIGEKTIEKIEAFGSPPAVPPETP